MKTYNIMILIAVAIQSFACAAMDKDNDQQLIEAFVTRKQQRERDERISFCSSIDSDFTKYFPNKRLPLPTNTHAALLNISAKQPKNHNPDSITEKSPAQAASPTFCPPQSINTPDQALTDCKKTQSTPQPALIKPVKVKSQANNRTQIPLTKDQEQEKIFADRGKIEEKAEKLYAQLASDSRKSKRNGPYLHKGTNQLFFKLTEYRSCVYNATTHSLLVLDTPYKFPDEILLQNVKAAFVVVDNPEPLQSAESVIQWK